MQTLFLSVVEILKIVQKFHQYLPIFLGNMTMGTTLWSFRFSMAILISNVYFSCWLLFEILTMWLLLNRSSFLSPCQQNLDLLSFSSVGICFRESSLLINSQNAGNWFKPFLPLPLVNLLPTHECYLVLSMRNEGKSAF